MLPSALPPAVPAHQLTFSTLLLLGLLLSATAAVLAWSWRVRQHANRQRRQAAAALRAAEALQIRLASELPISLFSFSPGTGFLAVSEGISRLVPIASAELLATPVSLLSVLELADSHGLEWLRGNSECPASVEWVGRTRASRTDEVPRWLRLYASMEIDVDGRAVLNGLIMDITPLKTSQIALEASREELQKLAAHRENEREEERRHLAREFHDEVGQLLTGARLRLQLLLNDAGTQGSATIREIDEMLADTYRSVKTIVAELRPPALNLGLSAAVEWQAERTLSPSGLSITTALRFPAESLPDPVQTVLFRIIQESFANIVRHAQAHSVHVSLREEEMHLVLEVSDDGQGFSPQVVDGRQHFGLSGMRERALALGGTLEIDSAPGEGTRLHVRIPLKELQPCHAS